MLLEFKDNNSWVDREGERKTLTILTRSHSHGEVVYFSLSSTTQ